MRLSTKYSGPLNNTGLNCVHSLIRGFFQIIHTVAPHGPRVVESMDAEHRIQRTYCKVTLRISTARKWTPHPWAVQVSTVVSVASASFGRCILLSSNHWPQQLSTCQLISSTSHWENCCYYPCFTDEETEAPGRSVAGPKLHKTTPYNGKCGGLGSCPISMMNVFIMALVTWAKPHFLKWRW